MRVLLVLATRLKYPRMIVPFTLSCTLDGLVQQLMSSVNWWRFIWIHFYLKKKILLLDNITNIKLYLGKEKESNPSCLRWSLPGVITNFLNESITPQLFQAYSVFIYTLIVKSSICHSTSISNASSRTKQIVEWK